MAQIFPGHTKCAFCGETIGRDEEYVRFATVLPPTHPLWKYSDGVFHAGCYESWPRREEFQLLYDYYCMNEFQLFAHGVEFDPNAYLASTPLKFDGAWHKGESGHDHPKSSGVFKFLGDGQKVPLFEQQKTAVEYLSANREALKALAKYPGVTTFILGLQYYIELDASTDGFCMGPSPLLMWHCLDIGVSPTFYVSLDRRRERESEQDAEVAAADGGRDSGSS